MGVKVSPAGSDAVVEIDEELVERYEEQGWTRVKTRSARKSDKSSDEK